MKSIFFLSFLTFTCFGQIQIPDANVSNLPVTILNYNAVDQVVQLKKIELGVELPAQHLKMIKAFVNKEKISNTLKLNPFLEWELDMDAVFTHLDSKTTLRIEGFYYTDYKVNADQSDWDIVDTKHPMRIRFSPPLAGKWSCEITLKVRSQVAHKSKVFEFSVQPGDSKGYVSVHPNKRNFQRDGNVIFPIGNNLCAPDDEVTVYHNAAKPELPPDKLNKAATPKSWKIYLDRVEDYYKSGGRYIRTIQAPWSNLIEFEEKGNYYGRLHYAWEQDKLIELSEGYDALILFNLMMHTPIMKYGDFYHYDWDWDNFHYSGEYDHISAYPVYCYNDKPGKKQPHEMFQREEDLKYHEQRIRYYIARYGYSTSIYTIELLSEPFHLNQHWQEKDSKEPFLLPDHPEHQVVVSAVGNFHSRMAKYIKEDLGHKNHLIGVNTAWTIFKNGDFFVIDSSLFSPNIDIIGVNPYSSAPNKLLVSKSKRNGNNAFDLGENSYANVINEFHKKFNKPIMISEGGPSEHSLVCSNASDLLIDIQTFQMLGASGFNTWNGFRKSEIWLWPYVIQALRQTNNLILPVLTSGQGNWVQGREKAKVNKNDKTELKETQYYVSGDQSKAVGYVKNLSENYYSSRLPDKCTEDYYKPGSESFFTKIDIQWDASAKKNRPSIQGLQKRKEYTVKWYKGDKEIGAATFETSRKGTWVLEFPALNVTNVDGALPVVWFSIEVGV